jgi:hypothetical protein
MILGLVGRLFCLVTFLNPVLNPEHLKPYIEDRVVLRRKILVILLKGRPWPYVADNYT